MKAAAENGKAFNSDRHLSINEWEEEAKSAMEKKAYDYIARGSGEESTLRANRRAFSKYQISHRVLRDVSRIDTSINLFGKRISSPVMLAPIGVQTIAHPEGELAAARAAASMNIPFVVSTVSSFSMEEIGSQMGNSLRWFQLYYSGNEPVAESMIKRAEASGYTAIVLTVDTPIMGFRESDHINKYSPVGEGAGSGNYFSDPVFCSLLEKPIAEDKAAALKKQYELFENPAITWEAIQKIRQYTNLPVLLKGVVHPEDAKLALKYEVDGLIVSNHGGRQLDHGVATLDVLEEICGVVHNKIPVLLDSGIRRGSDIFKALALGASAVLLGRPYIYGLAREGEEGVKMVVQQITREFETTMALAGTANIDEINKTYLVKNTEV
ncbi:alpha-hydroxy acid oxidase [Bacillus sp. P14.5]|uniref:alpha-hydroxy acid oxidase n=1 Tax=Bacillus sp. P14.5 TaxID=1983400 RepID=UPI001F05D49D|nr:alpha-hydroxy acid oxidase [Bacillus sp. P14.5]